MNLIRNNIIIGKISLAAYRDLLLHFTACMVIYVLPIGAIFIPVIIGLLFLFYKNNRKAHVLLLGVYALCCKSESVFFAYIVFFFILFLLDKRKLPHLPVVNVIKKRLLIFGAYLIFIYLFQLFGERSILSLPFFLITFLSPILVMFFVWYAGVDEKDIFTFLRHFLFIAIVQAIIAILFQALPVGISVILARPTLGDAVVGNTNSPNSLAFLVFAAILPFCIVFLKNRKIAARKSSIWIITLFSFFTWLIYFNDAKTLYFSFVLAAAFLFLRQQFFNNRKVGKKVFQFSIAVFIGIVLSSFVYNKVQGILSDYDEYINGKYNAKWLYYNSTFSLKTRPFYQYLLGTGAGTNGSRAGNALAYDVLYKKENTFTLPKAIPAKSNEFTKKYLSKYFVSEYADASAERSAILGNPFNSVCAMYVEFGIIGLVLFIQLLYAMYKQLSARNTYLAISAIILLFSDIIIAFLDQSFERPGQMFFTYMFIGFALIPVSGSSKVAKS